MFKSLSQLEKSMRFVLLTIQKGETLDIENDRNLSYALFCCCEKKYILNLHCTQVLTGDYVFQKTDNIQISYEGLEFLSSTSKAQLLMNNFLSTLHGFSGFIFGIIATVAAQYLIRFFGL